MHNAVTCPVRKELRRKGVWADWFLIITVLHTNPAQGQGYTIILPFTCSNIDEILLNFFTNRIISYKYILIFTANRLGYGWDYCELSILFLNYQHGPL